MTTATEPTKVIDGVAAEQWVRIYRRMVMIREFEENVNELYTRALMPGLAHLYIGEEAVAVGICEALRQTDYITSTHRGHGHCLAKGAAPDRMFAELPGRECNCRRQRRNCNGRRSFFEAVGNRPSHRVLFWRGSSGTRRSVRSAESCSALETPRALRLRKQFV